MPKSKTKGSVLPESILRAATRLFIERGFDGTSMYEIADELGVTRTAIYYYYKNKEEILVALTDKITRVAAQLAGEAAQHVDLSPIEALRAVVDRHVRLIIDHGEEFRVVERNEERLPPKRRAAATEYRRALEIKPGDPEWQHGLAQAYSFLGRGKDAVPLLRESLTHGPVTSDKYALLAQALESVHKLDEAEEMARKAVVLDSKSKSNHQTVANILSSLGKREEAERERKLAEQLPLFH